MKMGTKSLLFGAHQFVLHPMLLALAWIVLYGFPFDLRLWFAFFCHDLGYWSATDMDGPSGEKHPELGAKIMGFLFGQRWYDFTILHSRSYARKMGKPVSRLCAADKLATAITPIWLYVPMVCLTGEITEYIREATGFVSVASVTGDPVVWFRDMRRYSLSWVEKNKGLAEPT
jgi:hypothetical protein